MKLNLNLMQVLIHIKYRKWCVLAVPKKKKKIQKRIKAHFCTMEETL